MKNTLEFVIAIIVIVLLVGAMFFVKPLNIVDTEVNVSGDEVIKNEYVSFEDISLDYTMAKAIDEGTFAIDKEGIIFNSETLEEFLKMVRNNQEGNIRVVQEEMSGDIQILEIKHDTEKIVVKYRTIGSQVTQNEYLKEDGYAINSTTKLTNDGMWWNGCYIVKDEKDEIILFGYSIKPSGELSGEGTIIDGEKE